MKSQIIRENINMKNIFKELEIFWLGPTKLSQQIQYLFSAIYLKIKENLIALSKDLYLNKTLYKLILNSPKLSFEVKKI